MLFISLLTMMAGLVIYAVNADCDIGVFGLKKVTRNDQVSCCFEYLLLHLCECLMDVFCTLYVSDSEVKIPPLHSFE